MRLTSKCVASTTETASIEEEQKHDEVGAESKLWDPAPTLEIGSNPGPRQPVHPLRSLDFWGGEVFILLLFAFVYFGPDVWTMWREGIRITGPIVALEDANGNGDQYLVTVRDPATELAYTAPMTGQNYDVGTIATVIVHPTDRSQVSTPTGVFYGVVALGVLLVLAIAYPVGSIVGYRRTRNN